jgi:hypothetical protein
MEKDDSRMSYRASGQNQCPGELDAAAREMNCFFGYAMRFGPSRRTWRATAQHKCGSEKSTSPGQLMNLYMFPRTDGILLGGTFEKGEWSLSVNETAKARVLKGHTQFLGSFRLWVANY